MILLRKALAEDFEGIYPLFQELNSPDITKEEWRQIFLKHWDRDEDYFGYVLIDLDRIVGFIGLIFSRRSIDGKPRKFCNYTSWVVKKEYQGRGLGLSLILETIKLTDYTITNLTANIKTVAMFKRLGFKELETNFKILIPAPSLNIFSDNCRIETDTGRIKGLLSRDALKIYKDHSGFNCIHLVIQSGHGNSYLIMKNTKRKKMPLAQIHYISDLDVFLKCLSAAMVKICLRLKIFGLLIEERFLKGHKVRYAITSRLPHPLKLFKSSTLEKDKITDNLYTELFILDL